MDIQEKKKGLLTEEEKDFLKMYIKLTGLKFDYIEKDNDYIFLHITNKEYTMIIEYNNRCFNNIDIDKKYSLKKLGL